MADQPLMFDDLPETAAAPEQGEFMFDDLPDPYAPPPTSQRGATAPVSPSQGQQPVPATQVPQTPVKALGEAVGQDLGQAWKMAGLGLVDKPAESRTTLGFNTDDNAAKAEAAKKYEEDLIKSRPMRTAFAQFGRMLASGAEVSPQEIEDFITKQGEFYGDANDPTYRTRAREAIDYYQKNPGTGTIPGLETPAEITEAPEAAGAFRTGLNEALLNVPGAAGGLVAAGTVNRALPATTPWQVRGLATIGAGIVGGMGSQTAAEAAYDLGDDYLKMIGLDREQRRLNEAENPISAFTGQIASGLIGGRPTLAGGLGLRAAEAGIGAGVEGASQLAQRDFDPLKIGIAAAGSAAMGRPTKFGRIFFDDIVPASKTPQSYLGVERGEHITYEPDLVRAQIMRDLPGKTPEEVITDARLADNPQNLELAKEAVAAFNGRDGIAARRAIAQLDVKKNNGLSQETALGYVNDALDGFKNLPPVTVHPDASSSPVPVKDGTLGYYDQDTGEVHVFADALTSKEDAQAVAFHEVLGHAGLAFKYQKDLDNLLTGMYEKGNIGFKNAVDRFIQDNPNSYADIKDPARRKAAQIEEVLAEASENGALTKSTLDVVKNYIKSVARKAGMDHLEYTDREIRSILATGHDNIIKGEDRALGLGGIRAAAGDDHVEGQRQVAFSQGDNDNQNIYGMEPVAELKGQDNAPSTEIGPGPYKGANQGFSEFPQTERATPMVLDNPDGGGRTRRIPNPDTVFPDEPTQRFAVRNPSFNKRTEDMLDKHLSPDLTDQLAGWVKAVPDRPVVSDAEVRDNAVEWGLDMAQLRNIGAMEDNSDLVVGLKDFMNDKAARVIELSKDLSAGRKGTAEDEAALVKQVLELGEVMSMFDTTRSNLGRMFRSLRTTMDSFGDDYEAIRTMLAESHIGDREGDNFSPEAIREMAKKIAEGGDIKAVRRAVDRLDPDWIKYGNSYYYNSLLGTASVQEGNILGNAFKTFMDLTFDAGGAAVGKARSLVSPERSRATISEIGQRWKSLGKYLTTKDTYKDTLHEFTAPVKGTHKNEFQSQAHNSLPLSMLVETPIRALQAADVFFRGANEAVTLQGLAVRQANEEFQKKLGGKFGEHQGTDGFKQRVEEIKAAPSKKLLSDVAEAGVASVFQTEGGPIVKALSSLRNMKVTDVPTGMAYVLGRLMTPVVTAPVNIWKGAMELTSIPSFNKLMKGERSVYQGGKKVTRKLTDAEKDREVFKLMAGLATTYAAYELASNNEMTGLGPGDPKAKAEWLLSHKPQSIRVGDDWVSYKNMEPFATYLTMMADTIQETKRSEKAMSRKGQESWSNVIGNMVSAASQAALSNAFTRGLTDTLSDEGKVAEKLVVGAASPFTRLPWISEAAVLSDDYRRDQRGVDFGDKVMKRVQSTDAGVFTEGRHNLPIKIDGLGRPIRRVPEQETDPTAIELGRLFDETGIVIVGAPSTTPRGVPIPADIYNAHLAIVGPQVKEAIEEQMRDPVFAKYTDEQKAQVLKKLATKVRSRYGKILDQAMLNRDPNYAKAMMPDLKQAFAEEE